MKTVVYGHSPADRDIVGQKGVKCPHPGSDRTLTVRINVHHLARGMHTGVRAARADGACGLREKPLYGAFQHILHRTAVRLRLPAVIVRARVFNTERRAESRLRRVGKAFLHPA